MTTLIGPTEPELVSRLVLLDRPPTAPVPPAALDRLATLPCVVAGTAPTPLADVVAEGPDLAAVVDTVTAAPRASAAFALHLRAGEHRRPLDGLVAESALFSTLQAGPEHQAWLRRRRRRRPAREEGAPVRVERSDDALLITLARPHVHNALSASMRDALAEALAVAAAAPELAVHLRGDGPSFCAGGDLDEFGTAPDPTTAHLVRTSRSLAAAVLRVADRTTVHLHGAAAGAGIELAALARTVVAAPDTRISLPELSLGLVPGAGGTVSLPRRVGRQRTAWLGLTGRAIDAVTAHAWGLVDRVGP